MKLLIISGMPHYRRDGVVVGWGPTAQEIDHLAEIFDEVRHIGLLHPAAAPTSALPYRSSRVTFIPAPPSGGKRLADKLNILLRFPAYLRLILRELRRHPDVIHVRCPDNISLLALVLLTVLRHPRVRWVKYAGNWRPDQRESWSYTFQRRWLEKNLHRGLVTVNGRWPGQPGHIHSFINPCLTEEEIAGAHVAAEAKSLGAALRLIFVGRLETAKGVGRALDIAARLRREGVQLTFDLVGDGPERPAFQAQAQALGLADVATFHGWLPRPALAPLYARSHVMLFPTSASEGWPKVLSEAMAYGVVPLAGSVSCIGQFLGEFQTGRAIPAERLDDYLAALRGYLDQPGRWKADSERAVAGAAHFTYPRYLDAVRNLLGMARPPVATRDGAATTPAPVPGQWKGQQA